jgi:hypothetical protein
MSMQLVEDRNIGHIEFDQNKICLVENDNQLFVPLKPICTSLELDWKNQYRNLLDDVVLNSVMVTMTTTGQDGKQYEMICIPLSYLNGWLFRINPARYEGERRSRIIKYQKECYKALFEHFYPHTKQQSARLVNKTDANKLELNYLKTSSNMDDQAEKEALKVYRGLKSLSDYSLCPQLQAKIRKHVEALNKDSLFPVDQTGTEA